MNPHVFERARTAIALVFIVSMTTAQSTTQSSRHSSRASTLAAPCIPYDLYSKYPGRYPGRVSCPPDRGSTSDGPATGGTSDGPTPNGGVRPEGGTSDGPTTDGGVHPEGPYEPPRHHGGGHGGGWDPLIEALTETIATGTAIEADHGKVDFKSSRELDADGPKFPSRPVVGGFQIHGYARAGWPFVVDIQTQPGTYTWLELRYEHEREPVRIDLSSSSGNRRTQLVYLPGIDSSVQVARYSLHSALLPPGRKAIDVPMTVYGIGAGPNAAGLAVQSSVAPLSPSSVGLMWAAAADYRPNLLPALSREQRFSLFHLAAAQDAGAAALYLSVTAFGPTPATSPASVKWAVTARRQFPLSRIEVLRYPDANDKKGKFQAVARAQIDLLLQRQASGVWGTLQQSAAVGAGRYALQARAWRTRSDGGDWTGAYSANFVSIQ